MMPLLSANGLEMLNRRRFLGDVGAALSGLSLVPLLAGDGLLAAASEFRPRIDPAQPYAPRPPQLPAQADRAGFIVNRLLIPYLNSAARLVDEGTATREDIDAAITLGLGHPMGPLALMDLIGIDTTVFIAEVLHREFAEPQYAPAPLLRRMAAAGRLGRKAGRGFYDY